jgi:hypothetical protein
MEILQRIIENFFGRLDGPLHFRFILQPLIAVIFAVLDGLKDAKTGQPAYFWALIYNSEHRKALLQSGWKHVGKIFIIASVLDVVYQLKVFNRIYPGEILIVAFVLAIVPYLVVRGPVNRLMNLKRK